MPKFDQESIERKIARIEVDVSKLKQMNISNPAQFDDFIFYHCTERLVQKIVDAAIDVNSHILANEFVVYADSGRQSFILIGNKGLIDKELSNQIGGSVGLRNIIVHGYDDLDTKILLESIPLIIVHYTTYYTQIKNWLNTKS